MVGKLAPRKLLMKFIIGAMAVVLACVVGAQEEEKSSAPGLILTFEHIESSAKDSRRARIVALYVRNGASPTPFLPGGPFRATWEGDFSVLFGTQCALAAEVRGEIEVLVNGKSVLKYSGKDLKRVETKPFKLKKGRNRLVVRYTSPKDADAVLRLHWKEEDEGFEPLPPKHLSHDAKALHKSDLLRRGRELIGDGRCLRCHKGDVKVTDELQRPAPSLVDAGARFNADWMATWILKPRSLRSDTTMPAVLGSKQEAADIAAYLTTLGKTTKETVKGDAKAGRHFFALLKCYACHTLPGAKLDPERVPLTYVTVKWKPAALREFLKDPRKHDPWRRMPDFDLSEKEISSLMALLFSKPTAKLSALKQGDVTRGRTLVQTKGCLSCHDLKVENKFSASAWKDLPKGKCKLDFAHSDDEAKAIRATDLVSLGRESPVEFTERQLRVLRCIACHNRDTKFSLSSRHDDEAVKMLVDAPKTYGNPIAQWLPRLTWAGERLKTAWTKQFLLGKLDYRPRPWLKARMPAFPTRAKLLAEGLSAQHGFPPNDPKEPPPVEKLSKVGRALTGKPKGFNCVQCHYVGTEPAGGVFEAPGPNLMYTRARIRKTYYDRWMVKPLRAVPGTKMPRFSEEGYTQLTEYFNGEEKKQFDAIWQYLMHGEKIKPSDRK